MLKVVETFSGIGAQSKALKRSNIKHEILRTADWDIYAIIAYDLIHSNKEYDPMFDVMTKEEYLIYLSKFTLSLDGKKPAKKDAISKLDHSILKKLCIAIDRTGNLVSVTDIKGEDLPDDMNILTYSFPCQDLSVAGFWHGNKGGINRDANNRSSMLWQIERMLLERKQKNISMPKFLLMENVRNITSKQHIDNFEMWQNSLKDMGYTNIVLKLNASDFGIPQKRVRIYMVSVLTKNDLELEKTIKDYFEKNSLENSDYVKSLKLSKVELKDILKTNYQNKEYKFEADFSQPNNTKSRMDILNKNTIIYKNGKTLESLVSTLTTKQDRHPNSGLIEYKTDNPSKCQFRYLTPREGFLLMGFDESDYQKLVDNNFKKRGESVFFTRDKLNKMAGNSIVVNVLEEIFKQIDYINDNIIN